MYYMINLRYILIEIYFRLLYYYFKLKIIDNSLFL